ncbi:MAG: chromosome segregation protein ParM [Alcaligenaceae bacterium]|nr:chromosome segregation protein ParM [Alcaligenaceae bacterium]
MSDERKRREDAANFAHASVGLEGFKISAECEARAQLYINGKIDFDQLMGMPNPK